MALTPVRTVSETKMLLKQGFVEEEATTPFRGESEATSAWRALCKRLGAPFLARALAHVGSGTPAEAAGKVLEACYKSVDRVHPHLRECLASVSSNRAEDRRKSRLAQRNLFFLRFLSCACVHPSDWGLEGFEPGDEEATGKSRGEKDAPSTGTLSPTRRASIGRELLRATSDVTTSSGAVQIFLDRLTDLVGHATVHPMDLRHFLAKPNGVSDRSASVDGRKAPFPSPDETKPAKKSEASKSEASKSVSSPVRRRSFASPLRKTAKKQKRTSPACKPSKRRADPNPFDCFKLPVSNSLSSTDALRSSESHSPKLPFDRRVSDLDADGLAKFLFDGGFPELVDVFRRNSVTGRRLAEFSETDLECLGLTRDQRQAVVALVDRHL